MHVIDSSGWLEWFTAGPTAEQYRRFLGRPVDILVPAIVVYEVYKVLERGRGEEIGMLAVGHMQQSNLIPFDERLALHAADLALQHGLAMADAIVYATARLYDCELVTSDADLEGLEKVTFIPKIK